jgi:hypothetical protein
MEDGDWRGWGVEGLFDLEMEIWGRSLLSDASVVVMMVVDGYRYSLWIWLCGGGILIESFFVKRCTEWTVHRFGVGTQMLIIMFMFMYSVLP